MGAESETTRIFDEVITTLQSFLPPDWCSKSGVDINNDTDSAAEETENSIVPSSLRKAASMVRMHVPSPSTATQAIHIYTQIYKIRISWESVSWSK